jgi:type 1 glutamine amidotransferase
MKAHRYLFGLGAAALAAACLLQPTAAANKGKGSILVYSGSTGYRHESIPAAVESLKAIGAKLGYTVDASEDPNVFTTDNLAKYKVLVLVSNSTDPKKPESEWFVDDKREALQGFLKAGKGVVALHAAADSHYHWPWYGQMIGGYFASHPKGTPPATQTVADANHPATAKLPKTITRTDEWYYYKDVNPLLHVLITVDPSTIGDGQPDVNPNPLVWYHEFGGGRVFYSGLGHAADSYNEPYMQDLLSGALQFAVGK